MVAPLVARSVQQAPPPPKYHQYKALTSTHQHGAAAPRTSSNGMTLSNSDSTALPVLYAYRARNGVIDVDSRPGKQTSSSLSASSSSSSPHASPPQTSSDKHAMRNGSGGGGTPFNNNSSSAPAGAAAARSTASVVSDAANGRVSGIAYVVHAAGLKGPVTTVSNGPARYRNAAALNGAAAAGTGTTTAGSQQQHQNGTAHSSSLPLSKLISSERKAENRSRQQHALDGGKCAHTHRA